MQCISCSNEFTDASRFVMTASGSVCDECHRRLLVQHAEVEIREPLEEQDFREQNFGVPIVSIALCIIAFLHVVIGWFDESWWLKIIEYAADQRSGIMHGQVYRLVTSLFLHAGFGHWFMNALALMYIGSLGEKFLGRWWFLLAFFVAGIGGSAASAFLGRHALSIGASAAIYGLFSCVFVEALQAKGRRPIKVFRRLLAGVVVFMLLNEVLVYLMEQLAGSLHIDHIGHLGGLIIGAVFGFLVPMYKEPEKNTPST